jgi:hypothetical protein
MIDKETLLAEKADALRLRDEAQAKLQTAQQVAQQAQTDVIGYTYASQQIDALLLKLEAKPAED